MKLKSWPNGLGFSLETSEGEWDFCKVTTGRFDTSADKVRGAYVASFFPRASLFATKSGKGETPTAAMQSALSRAEPEPSPSLGDCQTPDDLLAAASIFEEQAAA